MRVLIVDDDADFRRILRGALERRSHEVSDVTSAFGLVNRVAGLVDGVQRPRPDVVVLDFMLPGLSGASALELLARDPRSAQVPVVLVSHNDIATLGPVAARHPRCGAVEKTGRMSAIVDAVESMGAGAPVVVTEGDAPRSRS
jgi:CheY-like chemotaxis protein